MTDHHRPVLLEATVAALLALDGATQEGQGGQRAGVYVDGTFGRGGHSRALLTHLAAQARLVVLDKDPQAIAAAQQLAGEDARVTVIHDGFSTMAEHLRALGVTQVAGILLDLGVSSPQIDAAERGFSFMRDGPLDMRMDTTQGMTAAQWLGTAKLNEIHWVIKHYGEERFAFPIAKAIVAGRASQDLATTGELARLVAAVVRTREKGQHPATRTFQAIRIHLNQELEELKAGLAGAVTLLAPKGRLAVISFHSLEDRIVKQTFAAGARAGHAALARLPIREQDLPQPVLRVLGRIQPSAAEIQANARARSAVLRVAERTDAPLPPDAGFVPQCAGFVPQCAGARARRRGRGLP